MSKQTFLVRHGLDRLIPWSEELSKREDVIAVECDIHDSGPKKGQPILPESFKEVRRKKILEKIEDQTGRALEEASQPARPSAAKTDPEDEKLKTMSKAKLVEHALKKYDLELDPEDSAETLRARIKAAARAAAKKAVKAKPAPEPIAEAEPTTPPTEPIAEG